MPRLLACLLALSTGCTFIIDDEIGTLDVNLNAKRDVTVTLLDMDPHIGQYVDVQIIRPPSDDNPLPQIQARGIFEPLPTGCVELSWPLGASVSATRVDFYADLNGDGMLSEPGTDHLWRRELDAEGEFRFIHDVEFDDISVEAGVETGNDLMLDLTGVDAHDGQSLVVSVIRSFRESADGPQRTTVPGALVVGTVEAGAVSRVLPGVIDDGDDHTIELNFGDGANVCRTSVTAPAGAPLVVSGDLSGFECGLSDPQPVFMDVTARERCME